METITSRDNAQVKELAALLARKKYRDETGLFALEGVRLCVDALRAGVMVERLFVASDARQRYPELEELLDEATGVVWIDDRLADRIADVKTAQGVFAVCRKLDNSACAVTIRKSGLYILLQSLQDPGNLGSILRTVQALGLDGAVLADCPDLYSPKVLRASMGGVFRLPVWIAAELESVVRQMKQAGIPVAAAALDRNARPLSGGCFANGGAVMIGNEGSGLTAAQVSLCDFPVYIPMHGGADSLGAAAAAGVFIWEMTKNRRDNRG